ncbi:MAG TPA: ABC transporter substrate-binding protein [Microbacteriaceae bacterium]|nr:ABC transporter substrate-binding protein [Microbacteriaceae bacterium]
MSIPTPFRLSAIAGLGVAALALVGCATGTPSETSTAAPTVEAPAELIPIHVIDVPQSKKVEIAAANGFFERHGLDVTVEYLATGSEILSAVQGGSAPLGYADVFSGLNAVSNGFDVQFIVSNNGHGKETAFAVLEDSPITKPSDLAGQTIGVLAVPQFVVQANAYLENNDVDPASVEFSLQRQQLAFPEAIGGGSVAGAPLPWNLFYSNQGQDGAFDFRLLGDPSNEAYLEPAATSAGFWATAEWADANPEIAQAFADALREFNTWYQGLSVDELQEINLEWYDIDLLAIAGDDEEAQQRLFKNDNLITGPIDIAATKRWIETGIRFAPDNVAAGVDFEAHVFESAR